MRDILQHDLLVGPGLPHATIEERPEVLRARGEMRAVRVDCLALYNEGHIGEARVVHELPQVVHEIAGRNGHRLEPELVEVVEDDAAVVAAEHIQRVVVHFGDERRPPTWWVIGAHHEPRLAIEAELVQVVQPILAAVTAEEEQRIAVHHARVEVSGRGHLPSGSDAGPRPLVHPELVEVVHAVHAVVAAEEEDRAVVRRPARAAAARGDEALDSRGAPDSPVKVEVVHVVQPSRAVVASDNVHEAAVLGGDVAEASRRHCTLLARRHCRPCCGLEVEGVEVVEPREARVASEEVHLVPVHNRTIVLPASRNSTLTVKPLPAPCRKVEAVDVVQAAAAAVAAEHIEGVSVDDTRGTASLAGFDVCGQVNLAPSPQWNSVASVIPLGPLDLHEHRPRRGERLRRHRVHGRAMRRPKGAT
mmetsp:Transcript_57788/g.146666  ORF Transcript_57788/g.146666 Transcript_57788/m.146666 type:complete len:418 (+) Transcript_57788:476-1729(+)